MRVTIAMVAKEAGVSRGTVDRVLNNRGNVKPEVEKRVREVIEALGYKPNRIASALSYSKSPKKVAFIYRYGGVCFNELMMMGADRGIHDIADFSIDVDIWVCHDDDPEQYINYLDTALREKYDGVAINALNDKLVTDRIDALVAAGIPVVAFNSDLPDSKRCCFIGQDLFKSGMVAGGLIAKLIKPGKCIVMLSSDPKLNAAQERIHGFTQKLKEYNVTQPCYNFAHTMERYEQTYEQLEKAYSMYDNIGAIYLISESSAACGDFILSHEFDEKPVVICHDLNRDTVEYLQNGCIDYVVEQNVPEQGYKALITLKDIIRFGVMPPETHIISDLSIKDIDCV